MQTTDSWSHTARTPKDLSGAGDAVAERQPSETLTSTDRRPILSRLFAAWPRSRQPFLQAGSAKGNDPGMPHASSDSLSSQMALRRLRVDDVAVPKAEIVSIPLQISKSDLVKVFRDSGLSRLPVYEGTLDSPVGMVHLKDFALQHGFNGEKEGFDLRHIIRNLLYVPPSMPIGVLLARMQAERLHMALVIDEYGGVDGLVTIEDLIEEVVGEIEDEHDSEDGDPWFKDGAGSYLAFAKAPLDQFEALIDVKLGQIDSIDADEIDTLGGLVFVLFGRVPARGEVVRHPSGVEFEVIDADPRRIKRLRIRLPDAAARPTA